MSAGRRQARIYALQALYQIDVAQVGAQVALQSLWSTVDNAGLDGQAPDPEELEFTTRIVEGVEAQREQIDQLIDTCSNNWRIHRMPVVDRNILRLATFELLRSDNVPASVAINEAIELAKSFGTAESRAFVNGIVDRVGREIGRIDQGRKGRKA